MPGDGVPTPGRGAAACAGLAGAAGVARDVRADDAGVRMPPARGLGSPPEVGGLRDAGGTGVASLGAGGVATGGELAAPPGPANSAGSGSFSAAASARTAAEAAGETGGGGAGDELAAPPGPADSAGSGSFSAAASARTAAEAATVERGTGVCAEVAPSPGCAGFPAGAAGEANPVAGKPTRVPGKGVRTGEEPGVGTLDPAWPPSWGGFGGGSGDILQKTRIHEDPGVRYAHAFSRPTPPRANYLLPSKRASTTGGFAKSFHRRSNSLLSGLPSSTTNRYFSLSG